MNTLLPLLAYTAALVVVISAIQFTVLAFRNPFRSAWLRKNGADNIASMAVAAAISFSVGYEITSLIDAGVPAIIAIAATPALVFAVAIFNWQAFHCGERLRQADAGQSPFASLATPPTPRRVRARAVSG